MRVTTKGQITIPQHLREKYGITPNTDIEFDEENNHIIIKKKNTMAEKKFQRCRLHFSHRRPHRHNRIQHGRL